MSDYALDLVSTSDADISEVAAMLRVVFPEARHFTDEAVRWQYRDNPDGQVVGFNARKAGVLAAHYVTIPLMARLNGAEERGLLSLNTATHPAHQGKGLFTKLANATYQHAAEQGFGFVVGVANANSTHGFTKKLGFHLVSPLRAMVGVGRLPLEQGGPEPQYARSWNRAAITWRTAHPSYRYSGSQEGGAGLIWSERRQFGARYVLGAFADPAAAELVPAEARPARRKVWIGLDPAMKWRGTAFLNVPMRFRPSPLNLIFKDLSGQGRSLDPARVRFQAIDFDIL